MVEGLLSVVTPGGAQFDVKFHFEDRVLQLKRALRLQMLKADEKSSVSCLAMRLVHGIEDLQDDQVVGEGLQAATLTLITSPAPLGLYVFSSSRFDEPPPAGRNTSCKVEATFQEDATFRHSTFSAFHRSYRSISVDFHVPCAF